MAQVLRPDGNVTQTSFTNGFAEIDESAASDADFAYGANNTVATLEVSLGNPSATPASGTTTVRYRVARTKDGVVDGTGSACDVTCSVYQGGSLVAADSARTVTGSWTEYSFTPDMSGVTDWTDLRLRFVTTASGGSGPNRRGGAVSWAELEAPDAPPSLTATPAAVGVSGVTPTWSLGAVSRDAVPAVVGMAGVTPTWALGAAVAVAVPSVVAVTAVTPTLAVADNLVAAAATIGVAGVTPGLALGEALVPVASAVLQVGAVAPTLVGAGAALVAVPVAVVAVTAVVAGVLLSAAPVAVGAAAVRVQAATPAITGGGDNGSSFLVLAHRQWREVRRLASASRRRFF